MTKKQQSKARTRHPIQPNDLVSNFKSFKPLTENQRIAYDEFNKGKNLFLYGFPGTGKTYIACSFALESLESREVKQIRIIRSSVSGRDIGFLPGTEAEKMAVYEKPYEAIFNSIIGRGDAYGIMKKKNTIVFESSSFQRGMTYDDTFLLVDEFQNMSFEELNTIITRVGENTRVMFCGDIRQCDLGRQESGFGTIKKVLTKLPKYFTMVEMGQEDIVRSDLVREYIIAVERMKDEKFVSKDDQSYRVDHRAIARLLSAESSERAAA
jgi:phosphate starvation-inducible protein PhoH